MVALETCCKQQIEAWASYEECPKDKYVSVENRKMKQNMIATSVKG